MKKSIILISIILTCCLFAGAASASAEGGLHDGTYLIYDAADLTAFASYINSDVTHVATNAKLMADIDLTGVTWTPIGTSSNQYAGTFDGYGKVISGLYIHQTSLSTQIGLFETVGNGCVIENVGLRDVDIENTNTGGCGALVGNGIGEVTIDNCWATGTTSGGRNTGGLTGFISKPTITNCYVDVTVTSKITSGNAETGGLISGTRVCTISNCYVIGSVSSPSRSGGIVGLINPYTDYYGASTIDSCTVLATVSTTGDNGKIWGIYSNSGQQTSSITGSNNYAVSGGADATSKNGLSKTLAQLKTESFYTTASNWGSYTWDFTNTWYWDTATSLPKLQVFGQRGAPSVTVTTPYSPVAINTAISSTATGTAGSGGSLSYQWSVSTGGAYYDISGQTSTTLFYTPSTAGLYTFKCTVTETASGQTHTANAITNTVTVLNAYTPGNVTTRTSSIQAKTLETYQATNEFDFGSTILDVKYLGDTSAVVAAGNAIYMVDGEGATIAPLTSITGNTISKAYLGKTRAIINDIDNNVAVYDYANQTMTYIATNGSDKVAISPNYAYVVNDTGWLNIYNATNQIVASMQYTYQYLEVNQETDIFGYAISIGYYVQYTGKERKLNYYAFNGSSISSKSFVVGYVPESSSTFIDYSAFPVGNTNYWVIYSSHMTTFFRIIDITSSGSATITVAYNPGHIMHNVNVAETLSSIFSSNSIVYVYGNDAQLQGQYTAGGNLNDVSISYSNGLYGIAAGNDSNAYFINKEASASWVLGQATNFNENVYHSKMSYDGNQALIGTTNKLFLFKYSESVESSFYINGVVVGSDGLPYANKIIQIDANSVMTDDSGFFVYPVKPGQTYTIITGSKTTRYTATNQALQTLSIKITSQLISQDVTYGASYNSTSGNIEMNYNDAVDQTSIVVWSVRNTKTGQEVSRQSVSAGTQAYYFVPANKTSDNYFVTVAATRGNSTVKNTWSITPSGQGQTVNLFGMDDTGKNILFGFFIILLAGLFGYLHQHIGTIIVAFAAAVLRYLGLITVPWIMIIIAVVVAIVAAIAHRGEGK